MELIVNLNILRKTKHCPKQKKDVLPIHHVPCFIVIIATIMINISYVIMERQSKVPGLAQLFTSKVMKN